MIRFNLLRIWCIAFSPSLSLYLPSLHKEFFLFLRATSGVSFCLHYSHSRGSFYLQFYGRTNFMHLYYLGIRTTTATTPATTTFSRHSSYIPCLSPTLSSFCSSQNKEKEAWIFLISLSFTHQQSLTQFELFVFMFAFSPHTNHQISTTKFSAPVLLLLQTFSPFFPSNSLLCPLKVAVEVVPQMGGAVIMILYTMMSAVSSRMDVDSIATHIC